MFKVAAFLHQNSLCMVYRRLFIISASYGTDQHQDFSQQEDGSLYEGHRKTSMFQKGLLAVGSAFIAVNDPLRSDLVAALGETTDFGVFRKLQLQMLNDEEGSQILEEKPIIDSQVLPPNKLIQLPENTLGYVYAKFMMDNNLSADSRPLVHYVDNCELAYIVKRYRQIHDFVHAILGFSVTVPHEIIVKWFEYAHFGFPMNGLASMFGSLGCSHDEKKEIFKYVPWALYCGTHTKKLLLNIYFEKHLNEDFVDFKRRIGVTDPPYNPLLQTTIVS